MTSSSLSTIEGKNIVKFLAMSQTRQIPVIFDRLTFKFLKNRAAFQVR